jgi:hypothetical protein
VLVTFPEGELDGLALGSALLEGELNRILHGWALALGFDGLPEGWTLVEGELDGLPLCSALLEEEVGVRCVRWSESRRSSSQGSSWACWSLCGRIRLRLRGWRSRNYTTALALERTVEEEDLFTALLATGSAGGSNHTTRH